MMRPVLITIAASLAMSVAAVGCSSHGSDGSPRVATSGPAAAKASTVESTATTAQAGNVPAFCALITKNDAILMDIAAGDNSSSGVDATKLLHDLDAAAESAPAEVKNDMRTIVDFDRQIITKHTDIQETPALESAMQHYAVWTRSHCVGK